MKAVGCGHNRRAVKEEGWEGMRALLIATGSVILTDKDMERTPNRKARGNLKGSMQGATLTGYGTDTKSVVQGERTPRTLAKDKIC
ncbi:MAG: hypothetical protein V1927_00470 [Candidatus Omnitrophota bacterium]